MARRKDVDSAKEEARGWDKEENAQEEAKTMTWEKIRETLVVKKRDNNQERKQSNKI
mgnify:CR=1 FL=1